MLKKNWATVSVKSTSSEEELVQAQILADKLLTAVGEREQAPVVAAVAVRDRQAAFTLFVNAYDEVRAVIGYLRRKEGDADSIIPSLYAGRTVPKKKVAEDDTDNPTAPGPGSPTGNQTSTPGTTSAPAAQASDAESGPSMH